MDINMFIYYKTRKIKHLLFKTGYITKPNETHEMLKNDFVRMYNRRKTYIQNLVDKYDIRNKKMLDLCSGNGNDDVLFSQLGNNKVDAVEYHKGSCNVHKEMAIRYNVDNTIYNRNMVNFSNGQTYDVIYTSSPGNWMNEKRDIGIPYYFLKTVESNSEQGTLFLCLLYAGNFMFNAADEVDAFLPLFKKKVGSIGYDIIDYSLMDEGLLIASKELLQTK